MIIGEAELSRKAEQIEVPYMLHAYTCYRIYQLADHYFDRRGQ